MFIMVDKSKNYFPIVSDQDLLRFLSDMRLSRESIQFCSMMNEVDLFNKKMTTLPFRVLENRAFLMPKGETLSCCAEEFVPMTLLYALNFVETESIVSGEKGISSLLELSARMSMLMCLGRESMRGVRTDLIGIILAYIQDHHKNANLEIAFEAHMKQARRWMVDEDRRRVDVLDFPIDYGIETIIFAGIGKMNDQFKDIEDSYCSALDDSNGNDKLCPDDIRNIYYILNDIDTNDRHKYAMNYILQVTSYMSKNGEKINPLHILLVMHAIDINRKIHIFPNYCMSND